MAVSGARWLYVELGGCKWKLAVSGARWMYVELGGCKWS